MTCINRSQPPPPSPSVEYVANGSVAYSFSWFNWRLLQSLPPAPSVASCVAGGLFSFASLPRPSPALGLGAGFLSARCAVAYESTNTLSAFTTAAVSSIDVPSMLELASFVYNATNGTITTFFQQVLYFPLVTSLRRLAGCFFPPLWRRLRRNVSAPLYDPSDRRSAATPRSSPRVTINNFFLLTPPQFRRHRPSQPLRHCRRRGNSPRHRCKRLLFHVTCAVSVKNNASRFLGQNGTMFSARAVVASSGWTFNVPQSVRRIIACPPPSPP